MSNDARMIVLSDEIQITEGEAREALNTCVSKGFWIIVEKCLKQHYQEAHDLLDSGKFGSDYMDDLLVASGSAHTILAMRGLAQELKNELAAFDDEDS